MIFGKSHQQKLQEEQDFCKYYCDHRKKVWALFPTRLANGQLAWMCWVYRKYAVFFNTHTGRYYRDICCADKYFLEDMKRES